MPKTRTTPEINRPLQGGAANITGPVSGTGGSTFPHPSTVTLTTTNSVAGGIHTHRLDITTHIDEADAHHDPVTVGNTGLSLSTQVLSLNLAAPSGLQISSGLMLADGIAGSGLTIASKILAVGQGDGLTVSADAVALTTPGTLTHESTNAAAGSHTHAVTASANPGAAASLLKSDASGYLQLTRLGIATAPAVPLHVAGATQQARIEYNAGNYLSITIASDGAALLGTTSSGAGGNLTLAPVGDVIFDPVGNDILPLTGYDLNIGSLQKKYLTLHAAELWVETLVAQETIATIGGRILVGPTTTLTVDMSSATDRFTVKHNQPAYNDHLYLEADGKVEFLLVSGRAIITASILNSHFIIAGDWRTHFTPGVYFTVTGSTANDGEWRVSYSTYDSGADQTTIYTTVVIPSGVDDGYILYTGQQGVGPYYYLAIVRNRDGSGSNDWYAGDAVFNTGRTGDGFIDLYSVRGVKAATEYGPSIVGNVRNSSTYNDWSAHWALGNLNGVYGYGTTAYGFAAGKYANGASFVTVDATNGIRMLSRSGGVDTTRAQWAVDGVLTIGQVAAGQSNLLLSAGAFALRLNTTNLIAADTSGNLALGQVAANQGNAYWNATNKRLEFRGGAAGTVVQAYVDTTGEFVAGTGNVRLNSTGLLIAPGPTTGYLQWATGAWKVAEIDSRTTGSTPTRTGRLMFQAWNESGVKGIVSVGDGLEVDDPNKRVTIDSSFTLYGPLASLVLGSATLGALNVGSGSASAGQIRASGNLSINGASHIIEQNNLTSLADGATANLLQSAARYGLYFVVCSTDVQAALFIYDGAFLTIISDPTNTFSGTDTANKHCILLSGTTLTLKNRRGAAKNYRITRIE